MHSVQGGRRKDVWGRGIPLEEKKEKILAFAGTILNSQEKRQAAQFQVFRFSSPTVPGPIVSKVFGS